MSTLLDWDAKLGLAACSPQSLKTVVLRRHRIDQVATSTAATPVYYDPASDSGSRIQSGRYHRARDRFPFGRVWPALYTAQTDGGCIAEVTRHASRIEDLAEVRITKLQVELMAVLDLSDPATYGLTLADVTHDYNYEVTQEIGRAALDYGLEGILVPSASRLGINLVILTENLASTSSIVALDSVDPRLYVPRP